MRKVLIVFVMFVALMSINTPTVKADCIGGNSAITVNTLAEGGSITFTDPVPPHNQISVFSGMINCLMDGNPFKAYCVDLHHNVSLPDAGYTETCEYTVPKAQYILNNYLPLKTSYPGKLSDDNEEAASIQLALWSLYDNVDLSTITNTTVRDRALAIRSDADINGNSTPSIITFSFHTSMDPDAFFVKTLDENGDPIAVNNIVITTTEGTLSEDTVSTNASGISPDIFVSGASNGATITAKGRMKYAHGRITDGIDVQKQNLAIAFPVFGEMGITIEWGALPVELSSFTSIMNGATVELNWITSSERNNAEFKVERFKIGDGGDWSTIGLVSGNGTTTINHSYSYTDRGLLSGTYHYRLKQIDYNGNFEYFNLTNKVVIGIPEKCSLSQNYPNPFNPSTTIQYSIPKDGDITIKVFDLSGKEVMTVINEYKTAGSYSININGNNLSSGIYYYMLTAGDFVSTKKMTLIK